MILTYILVSIWAANSIYTSITNRRRLNKYLGLLDGMLPRIIGPAPHAGQPISNVAPPSPMQDATTMEQAGMVLPPDAGLKYQAYQVRDLTNEIAIKIMTAHAFAITYGEAYARAEGIVCEMFAKNDAPLSDKLASILGSPVGNVSAGSPNEASQPLAN